MLYEAIWRARPRSPINSHWMKAGVLSDPVTLFSGCVYRTILLVAHLLPPPHLHLETGDPTFRGQGM